MCEVHFSLVEEDDDVDDDANPMIDVSSLSLAESVSIDVQLSRYLDLGGTNSDADDFFS